MNNIKKRYGLWTGIAMVVGIVIGSGVFLKAGGVLKLCGGDLKLSILAWFIGGVIMITSGFCFAVFATRVTKYNGVIDYVEVATNKKTGYFLAWLMTNFYYPIIASVVALFAGSYFFKMLGLDIGLTDIENFIFAFLIVTVIIVMNYFSPAISAKFQVSATFIKLLPIIIVAVVGLFASLIVGSEYGIINAFKNPAVGYDINFGDAIKKTSFAYEGWVCATAINAELKDSKRNLPKALVGGTIAILAFYIIYYISLSAFLGNAGTIAEDANAPIAVFQTIMGKFGVILFSFFIMISCLGTVNGVSMGCCRGMFTMSCRGHGIKPEKFAKISGNRNISFRSCLYGYLCICLMFVIWYLAMHNIWIFGHLGAMDEIICAIIYLVYVTMYIYIMKNFKDLNVFKRFIVPLFAILGSIFFTFCGTGLYQLILQKKVNSLIDFGIFMILFVILMFPSIFFYNKNVKEETIEESNLIEENSQI